MSKAVRCLVNRSIIAMNSSVSGSGIYIAAGDAAISEQLDSRQHGRRIFARRRNLQLRQPARRIHDDQRQLGLVRRRQSSAAPT